MRDEDAVGSGAVGKRVGDDEGAVLEEVAELLHGSDGGVVLVRDERSRLVIWRGKALGRQPAPVGGPVVPVHRPGEPRVVERGVHLEELVGRPLAVLGQRRGILGDPGGFQRLLVVPEDVGVGVVRGRVDLAVLLRRAEEAGEEVVLRGLARVRFHQVAERHQPVGIDELADHVVTDVEDIGSRVAGELCEQLGVVVTVAGDGLELDGDVGVALHEVLVELLVAGQLVRRAPGGPDDRRVAVGVDATASSAAAARGEPQGQSTGGTQCQIPRHVRTCHLATSFIIGRSCRERLSGALVFCIQNAILSRISLG
nr:hypothetical protein [Microbacterium sp. CBA3102]